MASFDEVVVDEARFPRMFTTFRRSGMYRRCRCAGCPPCRNAAQRLLRGIASSGTLSGLYRPEKWGDRYRVYARPLGSNIVSVLTDVSANPTIVDVSVDPRLEGPIDGDSPAARDGQENEFSLRPLLVKGLTATSRHFANDIQKMTIETPSGTAIDLRKIRFSSQRNVARLAAGEIDQIPASPGIYLVQWSGGQYLGKGDNLRDRIRGHLEGLKRFGANLNAYSLYYSLQSQPRVIEKAILTSLIKIGRRHVPLSPIKDTFNRMTFTNHKREFELY
jgi:hypothetical protein